VVEDWSFRALNVLNDLNHEGLTIAVGLSPHSERVLRAVNQIIA